MTGTVLAAVLGGVIASMITLFGVHLTNRSRVAEENVIKQRAQWRCKVRSLIADAVMVEDDRDAQRIWVELALRLNPIEDPLRDDVELVCLVEELQHSSKRPNVDRKRIVDLASHILKHDWERAKWEAQGHPWEEEPKQRPIARSNSGR